jgi:hypothetical protein
MALTTLQQTQIRFYLGYPDLNRYKNTRLEGVIAVSGVLSVDAESIVTDTLTQLVALDAKLTTIATSVVVQSAGVKKVDEIEFFEKRSVINDLRKVGRMLVTRLSNILGVPIYGDVYGESGYPGDKYSAGGLGSSPTAGNLIPIG